MQLPGAQDAPVRRERGELVRRPLALHGEHLRPHAANLTANLARDEARSACPPLHCRFWQSAVRRSQHSRRERLRSRLRARPEMLYLHRAPDLARVRLTCLLKRRGKRRLAETRGLPWSRMESGPAHVVSRHFQELAGFPQLEARAASVVMPAFARCVGAFAIRRRARLAGARRPRQQYLAEDRGIEGAITQRHTRSRKDHPCRAEQPTKYQQKQIHTPILTLRGGARLICVDIVTRPA